MINQKTIKKKQKKKKPTENMGNDWAADINGIIIYFEILLNALFFFLFFSGPIKKLIYNLDRRGIKTLKG